MKRLSFVLTLCALAVLPAQAAVMNSANSATGNQAWSGVGLQFTVNSPGIVVSQLGVYDSGSNGIQGAGTTLTAYIFNTATQTAVVSEAFDAQFPGTLANNYLFKTLDTPVVLAPGNYTIMGYGFDSIDPEHNATLGGAGPTFDTGGGAISFVRDAWTGSSVAAPGTFPDQFGPLAGSSVPTDYFDGPNMTFSAVPVPGAVLLGFLGLGVAGLKLRKIV